MRCAIMQPTYLPWLGYFELMSNCDVFILLDDVQFVQGSWHQRNKIKTSGGELILTVPVLSKGKRLQKISEALINNTVNWRKKHFATIQNNYKKAQFFNDYIGGLNDIYSRQYRKLIELNMDILKFMAGNINIRTPLRLASQMGIEGRPNERIVNICRRLNADVLYDAAGAKDILDLQLFKQSGIKVIFQEYRHPVYRQLGRDFISYLSAIDLLFNEGSRSLDVIHSGSAGKV